MFDETIRELCDIGGKRFTFEIEADEDGYIDRQCPSEECGFQYKVLEADWENIVRDEEVFCPLCRHDAPAEDWATSEHREAAERQLQEYFEGRLGEAAKRDARRFNREHDQRVHSDVYGG